METICKNSRDLYNISLLKGSNEDFLNILFMHANVSKVWKEGYFSFITKSPI